MKKLSFGLWMIGGVLFALLSFLLAGADIGYSWKLALACAIGGLLWGVLCFWMWGFVASFSWDANMPRSLNKMLKNLKKEEQKQQFPCADRFYGTIQWNQGKGIKRFFLNCGAALWFDNDRFWIGLARYRFKNQIIEVFPDDVKHIRLNDACNFLVLEAKPFEEPVRFSLLKGSSDFEHLVKVLVEKRIYREKSRVTTGKLFLSLPEADVENSMRLLFAPFGKTVEPFANTEDVLYIHDNDERLLNDEYDQWLSSGSRVYDLPGVVTYYTWEETQKMIEEIRERKPVDFELLLPWLEQALQGNGFYFNDVSPYSYKNEMNLDIY